MQTSKPWTREGNENGKCEQEMTDNDAKTLHPDRVSVLMVATSAQRGLKNAIDSLQLHGYIDGTKGMAKVHHRVLGFGEKWRGWRHRMQLYRDAAAAIADTNPQSLLVCMDAYDALSMRPFDPELVRIFESFGTPLVLSMEPVCGGNCASIRDWWRTDGQRYMNNGLIPRDRYVNGGLLMGRAYAIRDLYQWMLDAGIKDDQIGLARYALAHRDRWSPDIQGRIFRNRVFANELSEADLKGQGCYFAHFPGSNDWCIQPYDHAVQAVLQRPSGVRSNNRGTPELFTAYIIGIIIVVLAIIALLWTLTPTRLKPPILRNIVATVLGTTYRGIETVTQSLSNLVKSR